MKLNRDSGINPLTQERERGRARFCRDAIVFRLKPGEADTINFCRDRGYLPECGIVVYRDGAADSWRITRAEAYAWAEAVEDDPDAFCSCLDRNLTALFVAADFRIRDSWAV